MPDIAWIQTAALAVAIILLILAGHEAKSGNWSRLAMLACWAACWALLAFGGPFIKVIFK